MHNCSSSEHKVCVDTYGSYVCECEQGYESVSDICEGTRLVSHYGICVLLKHWLLTDMNECSYQFLHNCTYMCVNIMGFYYCICEFWHSLGADGKTCEGKLCKLHSLKISRFRIHKCSVSKKCCWNCSCASHITFTVIRATGGLFQMHIISLATDKKVGHDSAAVLFRDLYSLQVCGK